MDSRKATRNYRLNKWTQLIHECRTSGKTVGEWCNENNINQRNYYYWLKCVREAACNALPTLHEGNPFVPVDLPLLENKIQFETEDQNPLPEITLRIGAVTMEVHRNASLNLIENTLRAIQNVR